MDGPGGRPTHEGNRQMNDRDKRIIIGSDHAAFLMKEKIKSFLEERGMIVEDVGPDSESSVDYPDFGKRVAAAVSSGEFSRGILLCGTGLGMCMVANRFPHVRAALCGDLFAARMSREHNDANILVMGARVIGDVLAMEVVKTWLYTPFEGGRHCLRVEKIDKD